MEFDCPGSAIAFFKDINMVEYKNGDSTKLILSNSSDIHIYQKSLQITFVKNRVIMKQF